MPLLLKLVISLLLGAAVGLEREAYEKRTDTSKRSGIGSLGIRTYSLISLLGALAGISYAGYPLLFIAIAMAFIFLLVVYYVIGSQHTKDVGMTTEIAILLCFVFGILTGTALVPIQIVIALTVVLILILSMKEEIKTFVAGVKEYELDAFISYAIIALVILPFLPDMSYTIGNIPGINNILGGQLAKLSSIELINPFGLWKVVAIITGIEVFGYFLEKTIGQKGGWILTSVAGGFISSTSTTQSLAIRSKKTKTTNKLLAAALIANVSSFLQHLLLIASLNTILLGKAFGYIVGLLLSGLILIAFFLFKKDNASYEKLKETKKRLERDSIFSLKPALQFALLFLFIKFMSKLALLLFGNSVFYITAAFSALAGIDAITINVSEMAGRIVNWDVAIIALMIANAVNLLAKSVYSFMLGSRSFSIRFFLSMFIVIVAGVIGLLLQNQYL